MTTQMNDMPSNLSESQVQRHPYSPPPHGHLYSRTPAERPRRGGPCCPLALGSPRKPAPSPTLAYPSATCVNMHFYTHAHVYACAED
eukprot:scaffold30451_cov72-Phaeocystis_antarctica.AAC.2